MPNGAGDLCAGEAVALLEGGGASALVGSSRATLVFPFVPRSSILRFAGKAAEGGSRRPFAVSVRFGAGSCALFIVGGVDDGEAFCPSLMEDMMELRNYKAGKSSAIS